MKIQCDFCGKDEALVFCTADDAALCGGCDHRVHHANKLASKHQRFSLLTPSSKENPLCDICQERRAFLFCQQDRAILCRECDLPIHAANEHAQKHNRFLLSGVKLSATSTVYVSASPPGSSSDGCGFVPDIKSQGFVPAMKISPSPLVSGNDNNGCFIAGVAAAEVSVNSGVVVGKDGNGSGTDLLTSSISEYLIEMLPGWHFEDFLDSCSASFGFCKNDSGHPQSNDNDLDCEISSFSLESPGIWVPRMQPAQAPPHPSQFTNPNPQPNQKTMKTPPKRWNNDSFAVPEIRTSPSSTEFKRSRKF
ncbi:hypothetical protein MLD38_000787 [Melastoma candidum]|uniref:Uncharacterized protein n=1 Tax=Melastoma candidum TaxID=119954 RepID=A0ACB9SB82_9MYRT|nr:hypothetical protein MLD38_000787 [Melastoma candidum]